MRAPENDRTRGIPIGLRGLVSSSSANPNALRGLGTIVPDSEFNSYRVRKMERLEGQAFKEEVQRQRQEKSTYSHPLQQEINTVAPVFAGPFRELGHGPALKSSGIEMTDLKKPEAPGS